MPDEPAQPVTVEQLLPAMVELGSIQHDLLTRLSRLLMVTSKLQAATPVNTVGRMDEVQQAMQELLFLQVRNRDVLSWLLSKAKPSNE